MHEGGFSEANVQILTRICSKSQCFFLIFQYLIEPKFNIIHPPYLATPQLLPPQSRHALSCSSPSFPIINKPMTKQLQDKIIRLQAEKTQQQSEFIQKKQHYQAIIQELQNENQKLRKYIEDNESFSMIESQAKSHRSSKVSSPVHAYDKNKPIPDEQKQNPAPMAELLEENRILREELNELTKTYDEQIDQIGNYFGKIQETYSLVLQKVNNNAPKEGQINDLVKAYETLLKDFESERLKYVEKIEELTNYIIKYDEKEKKMEEDNQRLEIELKIVKEELKIYKRSKITK